MAETIGGIQIEISGDQTKLNAAINSSVATAQAGGQKIASALNSATAPAANLTTALERLTKANMAFADENVRATAVREAGATFIRLVPVPGWVGLQRSKSRSSTAKRYPDRDR